MSTIQLTVLAHQTEDGLPYQNLHIQISTPDGIIEPQDLKDITLPEVQWQQGVVIEGKAPIWLYGYLVHACHPARWVACYDPRLGAVVVATHNHAVSIGQVLAISTP